LSVKTLSKIITNGQENPTLKRKQKNIREDLEFSAFDLVFSLN